MRLKKSILRPQMEDSPPSSHTLQPGAGFATRPPTVCGVREFAIGRVGEDRLLRYDLVFAAGWGYRFAGNDPQRIDHGLFDLTDNGSVGFGHERDHD